MRSIFAGIIVLSASTAVAPATQTEKSRSIQIVIDHQQQMRASQDKTIDVGQHGSPEDILTKRIEQDNTRLDRLIEICPSC